MRTSECVVCRQAGLVALVEQPQSAGRHALWRYIIECEETGEEVCDGWAGDAEEAQQSAEEYLAYLSRGLMH